MIRPVSTTGLRFIEAHEGLSLAPYRDTGGRWTIGYGHLILPGESDLMDGITNEQADELLCDDLDVAEGYVDRMTDHLGLSDNQFAALVSLAYNVGSFGPTLRGALKKKDWRLVCATMLRYCHDLDPETGKMVVVPGLLARRKDEVELFNQTHEKEIA